MFYNIGGQGSVISELAADTIPESGTLLPSSSETSELKIILTRLPSSQPGPEVIKLFSCSAELRLKFILLINVKMPTIVGILTFISRINY